MRKIIISSIVLVSGCLFLAFANTMEGKPVSNVQTKTYKFVKTTNKCSGHSCKCSGYWGKKHDNGTYEGNCTNSDGYGHTCGHGPEKHGLRKW